MTLQLHHGDDLTLDLPAMASWPASRHQFDPEQLLALRAADAAGRPLLIRGDPGTGKSQLAHAAAVASGRVFLPFVVDSHTEASDLLWRHDAVARLADAHLAAIPGSGMTAEALDPRHYVHPGPLWWAFDWNGAADQAAATRPAGAPPERPAMWRPANGAVLLIDEIDKADAEVPNGLLEALGNGRFSVPLASRVVRRDQELVPPPLVVITTNDERELPPAFLRRCLVLTLAIPKDAGELASWLVQRGRLHFPDWAEGRDALLQEAARMLIDDRAQAKLDGVYAPGAAEYIDLLRALRDLPGDPAEHMKTLRRFAFRKQPAA